ncbi:hypothetical protein BUALT_Bualt05G0017800 [Buddleja alternifolia]|uniref:Uncharacterized protein n=1 Tax=Buddleja alternifolia TaxID=168488 RepID=A0AAV6XS79_9LAMI|nr:hypothetical protein BUALT_Bualt05G0017800 [Buddleja alternifolia]
MATTMSSTSITHGEKPVKTTVVKSKKKFIVKMVIPFSLRCGGCERRTDKGDRICGLKEEIGKDSTFDVEIYRFTFTCLCCRNTFSIISDPGRYDYVLESGATLVPKKF